MHLNEQQVEAYRKRTLPAPELLAASDHLSTCPECRERVQALISPRTSVLEDLGAENTVHLTADDVAQFVAHELEPAAREAAEKHLALCPRCRGDVSGLQSFSQQLAELPAENHSPEAREKHSPRLGATPTFRETVAAFFAALRSWPALAGVGVAAAIIVGFGVWRAPTPRTSPPSFAIDSSMPAPTPPHATQAPPTALPTVPPSTVPIPPPASSRLTVRDARQSVAVDPEWARREAARWQTRAMGPLTPAPSPGRGISAASGSSSPLLGGMISDQQRGDAAEFARLQRENGDSHLVRGMSAAAAGRYAEAQQEFRAMERENQDVPATAELARELIAAAGVAASVAPARK